MSSAVGAKRIAATAGSAVVTTALGITTGSLTQDWSLGWWLGTAVGVVIFIVLQVWLTVLDGSAEGAVRTEQKVVNAKVTGSVRQTAPGAARQNISDSTIGGDVEQQTGG
jgi:hypothetical protein